MKCRSDRLPRLLAVLRQGGVTVAAGHVQEALPVAWAARKELGYCYRPQDGTWPVRFEYDFGIDWFTLLDAINRGLPAPSKEGERV